MSKICTQFQFVRTNSNYSCSYIHVSLYSQTDVSLLTISPLHNEGSKNYL
jgi:hypothetical protein